MVVGSVWGKNVMGLLKEDVFEVLAPFRECLFWGLCALSNLDGNSDLSNRFS